MRYIWLVLFLFSCQTVDLKPVQKRIASVEYQIAFQYYEHTIQFCLMQHELCALKRNKKLKSFQFKRGPQPKSCKLLTQRCVLAVDGWWRKVKKTRGWK